MDSVSRAGRSENRFEQEENHFLACYLGTEETNKTLRSKINSF